MNTPLNRDEQLLVKARCIVPAIKAYRARMGYDDNGDLKVGLKEAKMVVDQYLMSIGTAISPEEEDMLKVGRPVATIMNHYMDRTRACLEDAEVIIGNYITHFPRLDNPYIGMPISMITHEIVEEGNADTPVVHVHLHSDFKPGDRVQITIQKER